MGMRLATANAGVPELARSGHAPLLAFAALNVGTLAVAATGLLLDDRTVLGAPAWLKPLSSRCRSSSTR